MTTKKRNAADLTKRNERKVERDIAKVSDRVTKLETFVRLYIRANSTKRAR